MPSSSRGRSNLRSLARDAVRAEVAQRSLVFIDEIGFDEVTVEQIAAAAGISPRSFFRYFASKEDVVIGDLLPMGLLIEDELRARPDAEGAWTALRRSLQPLVATAEADPVNVLRASRVALSTPALRARTLERHSRWADLLAPVLLLRLGESQRFSTVVADSLVQSALSSLYVATDAWVKAGGAERYGELVDVAFEAVAPLEE
jgi:AcrR family transcriptional regulator